MELIEFGGMTPTSVTTAVIFDGGVKSYRGLRISRCGSFSSSSESRGRDRGNEEKRSPTGARAEIRVNVLMETATMRTANLAHF